MARHLTRELDATGVFENVAAHSALITGLTTRFHDLNGHDGEVLSDPDPAVAYPIGQALARDALASGGNGLLSPSARRIKGQCPVALRPHLVQNVRPGDTWVFEWPEDPTASIIKH